jgi:surface antigen
MTKPSLFSAVISRTACAALFGFSACIDGVESSEVSLDSLQQALDVCGETVPPERFIDGIPAYAQCDAFASSAVYSNNGVDTSPTKVGPDWQRTQYSGGYQCTELATRYLRFRWNVDYVPRGNAGEWCNVEPPASSGVVKTTSPVHGDLMVFAGGSCGAAAQTGHVNVVDTVDLAGGKLVAVEQNRARRGSYKIDCALCFLHAVVNDGGAFTDAGAPAAADAGSKPAVEAGASKPPEALPIDAARRDAGKADALEPEPSGEQTEKDAGRAKDASKPSADDEGSESEVPASSAEGCSLDSSAGASSAAPLWLLALALIQRTRRVRRRGCVPFQRR